MEAMTDDNLEDCKLLRGSPTDESQPACAACFVPRARTFFLRKKEKTLPCLLSTPYSPVCVNLSPCIRVTCHHLSSSGPSPTLLLLPVCHVIPCHVSDTMVMGGREQRTS